MSTDDVTRRLLLRGSALAGLGALLGACSGRSGVGGPSLDDAGADGPPVTDGGGDGGDSGGDLHAAADAAVLNALLSAEYAAIRAYEAGLAILRDPPMSDPLRSFSPVLDAIAARWQSQHRDHAAQLAAAVRAAGATPAAEGSGLFVPPAGFTASVGNVLRLACNAEKAAALAYNDAVAALSTARRRFLASTIEGDETQHYIVLYLLLKQAVAPGPGVVTAIDRVVPVSFVSNTEGMSNGLQTVPDLTYT